MGVRRGLAAAGVAVLVAGGLALAGAAPASANQVWHQSVGRGTAAGACPSSTAEEIALGWTEYGKSWAWWPNEGRGGYVCDREITWAFDSEVPETLIGCQYASYLVYYQFGASVRLAAGSPAYEDAECLNVSVGATSAYNAVYVGPALDPSTVCIENWGTDEDLANFGTPVWGCVLVFPSVG